MKNFTKLFAYLIFIPALALFSNAQNVSEDWRRVQSDNGEFSVEMPKNLSYFYDADGFTMTGARSQDYQYSQMQTLHSASGLTVMSVEIYKVSSPKNQLNLLIETAQLKTSNFDAPKDFTAKQYEKTKTRDYTNDKDAEISFVMKLIASKTHLYVVTVANRGNRTPAFERFLSSVRLGGSQTDNILISTLPPLKVEDILEDAPTPPNDLTKQTTELGKVFTPVKNSTPALMIIKPLAGYTEAARKSATTGNIRLRVAFADDGRVSKIAIVSGLPDGLNRNAFFSTLRIKFIPEEKNGNFETVKKFVEYTFRIY